MAGVLYLLIAVLSIPVHFVIPAQLIVAGDAAATASKIMASAGLFRMGIGAELLLLLSEIVLTVLLYVLLKPVSKTLSLVAAVSRLAMTHDSWRQSADSYHCVAPARWRWLPDRIRTQRS